MTIIGSIFLILPVVLVLLIWKYKDSACGSNVATDSSTIKGIGFVPIIGHMPYALLNYNRILDMLQEMVIAAKGQGFSFHLPFSPPYVLTNDPKSVEYILKTKFESFVKGAYIHDRFKDTLGNGIFAVDGHSWKMQRKTASNIFSVRNFRLFAETVFVDEMKFLSERLDSAISSNEIIDMQDLFFKFTLDGFAKIAFGAELNCMFTDKVPFALAFDRCQSKMDYRFFSPFWRLEETIFFWKSIEQAQDISTIRSFAKDIIAKRRMESENMIEKRSDLLTYFMRIKSEDGQTFNDDQLCDYVLNFIIAGRDTTAQALSWCIYQLSLNPKVEEKLLNEIHKVLEDGELTYDNIKEMKYANAVFNETLRLHPSVPKNIKQAVVDEQLPDGTKIKKGSMVVWSPWIMGRTEEIWGEDAKEFRPERWINPDRVITASEFPAFHGGPRTCLGKSLAELEGVFVLASLLNEFKIKILPHQIITYGNSLTLPMKNGLKCYIERRNK